MLESSRFRASCSGDPNLRWPCERHGRRSTGAPRIAGSPRSRRPATRRPSRRSSSVITRVSCHSASTCSARWRRPRTRCSTRSPPPSGSSWSASRRSTSAPGYTPPRATAAWTSCGRATSCRASFRVRPRPGSRRRSSAAATFASSSTTSADCRRTSASRSSLAGWREARALPCRDVREELAVARGAALRRGHLRRHLRLCRGCTAFREDMERQRRGLAVVLPVTPTLALRERALGAAAEAARAGGGAAVTGASAGAGGGLVGSAAIKVGAGAALLLSGGAAAFGGFPALGPLATAPAGAPSSERAAASGPGPALVQQAVDPKRTSKQLWERTVAAVAASLDARRVDETLPALPETPEVELPSAEPVPEEVPEAPTLPAPQAPAVPAPQVPAAPQPVPEVPEAPAAPQPVPEVPEAPAAPQPELPPPGGG